MSETKHIAAAAPVETNGRNVFAPETGNPQLEKAKQERKPLEWATVRKLALKQLNRFMALEPKVLRGDEPDALHDMRVASRRLQQILDLIYPKPRPHAIRGLRKKIQRSRRSLSEVRNCDVLIAHVERELAHKRATRREARQALLQFLLERRTANFEKALKKLGKINLAVFYVETRRTLGGVMSAPPLPHPRAASDGEELTPALLCRRLAESLTSVWDEFEAKQALSLNDPQPSAVHGARIATKRLRYLLEVVDAFDVPGSRENLVWLRSLQRLLGEWHDLEVLEQTMIEMVARPDFLRERLDLAMGVEKLILRNRDGKKKMQEKYFRMLTGSPESARLREWVNYLVSSPSEAFGAPAA
jgi:CHAD domain-containing protein